MRGMTALVWLGSAVDPDEVNISMTRAMLSIFVKE